MKLRVFFRLTINISDDEQLEGQNDENRDILDETGSEFVSVASSLNFLDYSSRMGKIWYLSGKINGQSKYERGYDEG